MTKRPKHYDRPRKRPGPPRVRANDAGGSIIDQRAPSFEDEDDEAAFWEAEGMRCALDGMDLPDGAYLAMADEMGIEP